MKNSISQEVLDRLLHRSIFENDLTATSELLSAGANPNTKDNYGNKAVCQAVYKNKLDLIKKLVKFGLDINADVDGRINILLLACNHGKTKIVEYLIKQGVNVNESFKDYGTALMCAAAHGSLDIVFLLLENNADPFIEYNDEIFIDCLSGINIDIIKTYKIQKKLLTQYPLLIKYLIRKDYLHPDIKTDMPDIYKSYQLNLI